MKQIIKTVVTIALLIASITLMLITFTVLLNESSRTDATVINVAGKQRMLSQKITREFYYLIISKNSETDALKNAVAEFETSLDDLIYGNKTRSIYKPPHEHILDDLNAAKNIWQNLKTKIKSSFEDTNSLQNLESIQNESNKLLEKLEIIVAKYTEHSEFIRSVLQWIQYFFALLLVAVVSYSFYLIWDMRASIQRFVERSKKLGSFSPDQGIKPIVIDEGDKEELREAGEHINAFISKVDTLLRRSDQVQKQSASIADELSSLSDEIGEALEKIGDDEGLSKSEEIAITSSEMMTKTTQLLKHLKNELDKISTAR